MKRLERDAFHWPDTPDELCKVTLKEIHWLCDGFEYSGRFYTPIPEIGNHRSDMKETAIPF